MRGTRKQEGENEKDEKAKKKKKINKQKKETNVEDEIMRKSIKKIRNRRFNKERRGK